jgi:hypothetical protein
VERGLRGAPAPSSAGCSAWSLATASASSWGPVQGPPRTSMAVVPYLVSRPHPRVAAAAPSSSAAASWPPPQAPPHPHRRAMALRRRRRPRRQSSPRRHHPPSRARRGGGGFGSWMTRHHTLKWRPPAAGAAAMVHVGPATRAGSSLDSGQLSRPGALETLTATAGSGARAAGSYSSHRLGPGIWLGAEAEPAEACPPSPNFPSPWTRLVLAAAPPGPTASSVGLAVTRPRTRSGMSPESSRRAVQAGLATTASSSSRSFRPTTSRVPTRSQLGHPLRHRRPPWSRSRRGRPRRRRRRSRNSPPHPRPPGRPRGRLRAQCQHPHPRRRPLLRPFRSTWPL